MKNRIEKHLAYTELFPKSLRLPPARREILATWPFVAFAVSSMDLTESEHLKVFLF